MSGKRVPAPVNLKRLYVSLLAVTLTIGIICLVSLLKTSRDFKSLVKTYSPGIAWIDEMTLRLGETQSSFHRYTTSPGHGAASSEPLTKLSTGLEAGDQYLASPLLQKFRNGVQRLEKLFALAAKALEYEEWEDLQVTTRDFDQSSETLFTLLEGERSKLNELFVLNEEAALRSLRITGIWLILSLVISVFIALGLYFNWKRFERAVLGIEQ